MNDWRENLAVPERGVIIQCRTFPSAAEIIADAATKRRMSRADFIGRAALSIASYDLDLPWRAVTMTEHAVFDLRLNRQAVKHGHDFGPWQVVRLDES